MQDATLLLCIITCAAGYNVPPPTLTLQPLTTTDDRMACKIDDRLECKIVGFYPFPAGVSKHGPLAWIFRDTHQAVSVKTACGKDRLFVDFMTAGGQAHPVWWDERVKWHVLLGGSIEGEVRIRDSGSTRSPPGSKLDRLRQYLRDQGNEMQLYHSNCRVFACRVQREVERLNAEGEEDAVSAFRSDLKLAFALLRAGLLPAAYPLGTLWLCWEGIKDL